MRRPWIALALGWGAVAGCAPAGSRGEPAVADLAIESSRYDLVRLAPGVFATVAKSRYDPSSFAGSLIVARTDGVLVVDSREGPAEALELLAQIRAITSAPVRWLVNTHWHDDHIGGNQVFRDSFPEMLIVGGRHSVRDVRERAQARLDERLARVAAELEQARTTLSSTPETPRDSARLRERQTLADRASRLERYLDELRSITLMPPDIEVDGEWHLEAAADGAGQVRVIAVGPAHTDGDLMVYLPGPRILAPGDLVEEGLPWYGDGDPAGWAAALARLAALDFSRLVPAHGRVHTDRRLLDLQHRFVAAAAGAAQAAAEAALDPAAAARGGALDEYLEPMTAELHDAASLTADQRRERFDAAVATIVDREYAKRR